MRLRNTAVILGFVLGAGVTVAGCAVDDVDPSVVPRPLDVDDLEHVAFEHIVIDPHPDTGDVDHAPASACVPGEPTCSVSSDAFDPCKCTTDNCFDDWVDTTLGCDVCVVLACDEVKHTCHRCFTPPPVPH